ncbi:extracellular matrix protein 1-like isoform X2 [Hypomesus transpacificus]|uniref:extracellular matrix protein 1-like isoform X2 n=1 Tax=Hypomesus transpacificus TaxID=137520 RepID=UPI001F084D39|nr:extracellular matrix protein 1-like isoform X2 [Hypomesus transpacificus]
MGWSWAVACSLAFVLVFVRSESEESLEYPDMLQRPLELWEMWDPIEFPDMLQREAPPHPDVIRAVKERSRAVVAQIEVTPDLDADPIPQGGQALRPRSFGPPSHEDPLLQIPFPPAQPSVDNLQAICFQDNRRPRYPPSSLPQSGFGYLHRQAGAINRVESWYNECCQGNETQEQEVKLCCVRQAWEENLKQYCEEEFSIKTSHYHCCKKQGEARLSCFRGEAPNPTYQDVETLVQTEPGFTFDPNTCQRYAEKREASRLDGTALPQTSMTMDPGTNGNPQGRPMLDLPHSHVLFPPAQPSAHNLRAICFLGNRRPRYSALSSTGFGHLIEAGNAINRLESWYNECCQGNETQEQEVKLCCVRQAWEKTLKQYCEENSMVNRKQPPCCMETGEEYLSCFRDNAPNPTYQDVETLKKTEPVFTFDPNTCQRSVLGPRSIKDDRPREPLRATTQAADINFPPGRPSTDNIQSVCRFGKLRPLYLPRCLPSTGYGWLARQSKAVNRLEKGFKHCCKGKKEVLACADGKWREAMDRFCEEESQSSGFSCCEMLQGDARYDCFSGRAPHPRYDRVLHSPQSALQELTLGHICGTHKIDKKNVGFPVQTLVNRCCALPDNQRTTCVQDKLATMAKRLCSSVKSSSSPAPRCCSSGSQDSPFSCFSGLIMDAVTQATRSPRVRKRKCPLS